MELEQEGRAVWKEAAERGTATVGEAAPPHRRGWAGKARGVVLACALGWAVQKWIIGFGFVPTTSMEGGLLQGDWVLVAKGGYDKGSWVGRRMETGGKGRLRRGDIVVVEHPTRREGWSTPPQVHFLHRDSSKVNRDREVAGAGGDLGEGSPHPRIVKRIVALPGETVDVVGGSLVVSGAPEDEPMGLRDYWYVLTKGGLRKVDVYRLGVQSVVDVDGGYVVGPAGHVQAEELQGWEGVLSIERCRDCLPERGRWHVPKRGRLLAPAGKGEAERLAWMISTYEGREAEVNEEGALVVEGARVDGYAFEEDYYFVAGDNRPQSVDSRRWGPVPASLVRGKVVRIATSWDWASSTPRPGRTWVSPGGRGSAGE